MLNRVSLQKFVCDIYWVLNLKCVFVIDKDIMKSQQFSAIHFNTKSTYLLIHKSSGYALETSDQTIQKRSAVQIGPINQNNKRQLWLLQGKKGGNFEIINGFSDNVFTEDDGQLVLVRGTSSRHQIWNLNFSTDRQATICLGKAKNKYLCMSNGEITIRQLKNGQKPDIWIVQKVQKNELLNKTCFIISTDTKLLVDVPEASKKDAQQLMIYQPNYRYNQRWNIYRAGEIYVIKSYYNGLNFDVFEERYQNQNKIIQYSSHGNINQFWKFQNLGSQRNVFRIYACYDKDFELGHKNNKLILFKGRKFTWQIQGYIPL